MAPFCGLQQQQQGEAAAGSRTRKMVARRVEAERLHQPALRGRYSLEHRLGVGSFAEVWEARHRRTGVKVAVKILCPAMVRTKVDREVGVMRLLRHHPHIARFHEAIAGGHHVYIVMDLAEQGQLHDYVSIRGRLPEAEARRLFRQMVAGVAYCHRNMVVHRDLKMENVLLDSQSNVKIVDFGFSKLFSPGEPLIRGCCGSPLYAAPELHERRSYVAPPVDVWSCGVILYGMLCGCLPFDDDDMSELRRRVRRGDFRLPPFLSDDARDLLCGMLIVKPDKRMPMTEVAAHRWLQPGVPPYLAMPPLDATTQPCMPIDDETVQLVVTQHGFDRTSLLQSLHKGLHDEATVTYNLTLSQRFDAPTLYLWTVTHPQRQEGTTRGGQSSDGSSRVPEPQHPRSSSRGAWSLGGVDVLHECPLETMRRITTALHGLGILFHYSSSSSSGHLPDGIDARRRSRHRMVCARFPSGGVPGATIINSFLRLANNNNSLPAPTGGASAAAHEASSSSNEEQALEMNNDILESLSAAVFFEIQLYKAGEGNHYVLDFRRISGPQIAYLRICSQLASMLRAATH
ncbi:hypothetical protein ACP70R_042085 [Stipagrostis hirtigluma subsp. patula]